MVNNGNIYVSKNEGNAQAHLGTMHLVTLLRVPQYASAFKRTTDITYACKANKAVYHVGTLFRWSQNIYTYRL